MVSKHKFSVIFPTMIWIFMESERDEIKSNQISKRYDFTWCSNSSNLLSFELSSLSLLLSAEVSNKAWRLWIGCSQEWTPRWFWTDFARANLTASSTAKCLEVRAKCVRLKPATRLTLGGKSKSEIKYTKY